MGENIENTTALVKEIKGQQRLQDFMQTIPCSVCDKEPVSKDGLCEKCHKELISVETTGEKMNLENNGLKSAEPIVDIDTRLPEVDDLEDDDFEEDESDWEDDEGEEWDEGEDDEEWE